MPDVLSVTVRLLVVPVAVGDDLAAAESEKVAPLTPAFSAASTPSILSVPVVVSVRSILVPLRRRPNW